MIPKKFQPCRPYHHDHVSEKEFIFLVNHHFPRGEISITENGDFCFQPTSPDSVIHFILQTVQSVHSNDFDAALCFLENCQEPRARANESLDDVVFALYSLYLYLVSLFDDKLDALFDDTRINEYNLNEFGLVRENTLPFGLYYALFRLAFEFFISQSMEELILAQEKSPTDELYFSNDGNVFLARKPNDKVALVSSEFFPPISSHKTTIFGQFLIKLLEAAMNHGQTGFSNEDLRYITHVLDIEEEHARAHMGMPPLEKVESHEGKMAVASSGSPRGPGKPMKDVLDWSASMDLDSMIGGPARGGVSAKHNDDDDDVDDDDDGDRAVKQNREELRNLIGSLPQSPVDPTFKPRGMSTEIAGRGGSEKTVIGGVLRKKEKKVIFRDELNIDELPLSSTPKKDVFENSFHNQFRAALDLE